MVLRTATGISCGVPYTFSYAGSPDHDPLLFLHGFGTFPPRYTQTLELLAHEHHVLAPHLHATTLLGFADTARRFIREYTDRPYDLVGHSTGAGASILLATCGDARTLTYVNGPLPSHRRVGHLLGGGARIIQRRLRGHDPHVKYSIRETVARVREILTYIGPDPRNGLLTLRNLARFELHGVQVDAPTLILHTPHDEFFPPSEWGLHRLRSACPQSTLRMLDDRADPLSHEWPMFRPDIVEREILPFLRAAREGKRKNEPVRI